MRLPARISVAVTLAIAALAEKGRSLHELSGQMPGFSVSCRLCPRLARHLDCVKAEHPDYHARPVAPFGAARARLLIVGLAPGMHGANRTGRPFTGDHAGILLYETLHRFGYANRPVSTSRKDGLELELCRITNAVKCLPPANKPTPAEVERCNPYLKAELAALPDGAAILALGVVAHGAVLKALGIRRSACSFRHAARHELPRGLALYDSYHCSRYNTQTRRLTPDMFRSVFASIAEYLSGRARTASSLPPIPPQRT
jgi:uracil-DNA glycosylase family 4